MALRDRFSKIASYFQTDDLLDEMDETVDEVEELEPEAPASQPQEERPRRPETPVTSSRPDYNRPTAPTSRPRHEGVRDLETRDLPVQRDYQSRTQVPLPERPVAPSSRPQPRESVKTEQRPVAVEPGQTKISLKHPLRYEDATTIADAFLEGQCVLVDFEYMQEPQARRCVDFLTGACRVVNGNFQRIGATIYLLTPAGVVVDIEDVRPQAKGQEVSYDYDMKRR